MLENNSLFGRYLFSCALELIETGNLATVEQDLNLFNSLL